MCQGLISEIAVWAAAVATAGPLEVADKTVIWSDEKPVRSPIQEWDKILAYLLQAT